MSFITLSMIVKNEEKYLADCLESVKSVVDHIVIVDTGSTDNTLEIAKSYNADVYHFDWVDDFSAARNFALSRSASDWILYLDADERLDKNSHNLLKKIVADDEKLGVRCKIYNIDEINKKPKIQNSTRLFKYSNKIKFTGKAHEQIESSLLENGYKIIDSDLWINHLGYNIDKNGLVKKAERNLKLLIAEYKENPIGYYAFQIANTYNVLNDQENTFAYHRLAVKDSSLPNEYKAISYSSIADYYQQYNNLEQALTAIDESIKLDPGNVIVNLTASEIYSKIGKGSEAVSYCIAAYEQNKKKIKPNNSNKLLDLFIDEEKILYHGLHISYQSNEQTGIEFFFSNLEEFRSTQKEFWQKELHIIQLITSDSVLSFEDILIVEEIINENNINFYFQLLEHYTHIDSKLLIESKLLKKFPNNIKLYNRYASDLNGDGNLNKAIHVLEDAVNRFPAEPSIIIYLISLYLQSKELDKLHQFIRKTKEINSHNKKLIEHINTIEEKISSININTN